MRTKKYNENVKANTAFLSYLKNSLPEFFDKDNKFDIDKFNFALKEHNIDEIKDGYQLNFIGKDYARSQTGKLTTSVIVPDKRQNNKEGKNSENLFFTGDNLEVLRHLQNNYAKRIDVIYIDPPYNTGNDGFQYPDKFEYSDEKLKEMFDLNDEDVTKLKSLRCKSSHSAWLAFMYPRLQLAKRLLSDSGVIFISIDDNECKDLELIMSEIWGEANYVGNFVWKRKKKGSFLNKQIRKMTEYVLYYDNNSDRKNFGEKAYEDKKQPIVKRTNQESKLLFPKYSVHTHLKDGIYKPIYKGQDTAINFKTEIKVKNGLVINDLITRGHFIWSQNTLDEEIVKGSKIWLSNKFGFNVLRSGQEKRFKAPSSIIDENVKVGTNEDATSYLEQLFNKRGLFSYSKPVSLIEYLLNMVTYNQKDCTILDFFAGSGTTADAVMRLNAKDGGHRKFIMVQSPEKTYFINKKNKEIPKESGKAAFSAGYKTIDELAQKRISFAAKDIKENNKLPQNFDGSFKHYWVVEPKIKTIENIENFDPNNVSLFNDMIDSFSSKSLGIIGNNSCENASGADTILTTWLAKDGFSLNSDVRCINFNDYKAQYVEHTRLYLINTGWTSKDTKMLLNMIGTHKLDVQVIVLFAYSFNIAELRELEIGIKQLDINVNFLKRY